MTDEVSGVKALLDWDIEAKKFILDLDGEPYENHVFLDQSFTLEDTEVKAYDACIMLNEKSLYTGGGEWLAHVLQHAIYAVIGEEESITKVEIAKIKGTSTATMNEILALLLLQNISQTGLEELVLTFGFGNHIYEPFDV